MKTNFNTIKKWKSVRTPFCSFLFFYYILIFFNITSKVYCQDYSRITNLKKQLILAKSDTDKINTLKKLGDEYAIYDNDTSLYYYNEGLKIAQEKQFLDKEAILLNNIGIIYYNLGIYKDSYMYHQKAKQINTYLKNDLELGKCYLNIGRIYSSIGEYNKAMNVYDSAYFFIRKTNLNRYISDYYTNLGNIYLNIGAYELALNYYTQSLAIDIANDDNIGIAKNYNNVALTYAMQGDYNNALKYFFKAIEINEKINNKNEIANCFNNIGLVYLYQNDFNLAENYFTKAINIYSSVKNKNGIIIGYNNISDVYQRKAEIVSNKNTKNEYLNFAIQHTLKALNLSLEQRNKNGIILSYYQIGQLYSLIENYDKSLSYFEKGIAVAFEIKDKRNAAIGLNSIASIYSKIKNYEKALSNAYKSLNIAKEINALEIQRQNYSTLTLIYELKGDYKNAFLTQKQFQILNDTLFSKENIKTIKQLEFRYQTEKKQLEIDNLQKNQQIIETKIAKQKYIIYSITLLTILIIFIFSLSFVIYKKHIIKKENQKRNELLNTIKAEKQKMIDAQTEPQNISSFIKSITKSIQNNNNFETDKYLSNYINYLKTVLNNTEHESIYLISEIDCIKQFLQIEMIKNPKLSYNFNFSDNDIVSNYKINPMLIQPFIEDMLLFAQNNTIDEIRFYIDLSIKDGDLKCTFAINNDLIKAVNKSNLDNDHVLNTTAAKRLENINKIFVKPIMYNFRELKDEDDKFSGLELKIIIPLQFITNFI